MKADMYFKSLSSSIHKYGNIFIHSELSAALSHEQFGLELTAERLGPNGVSIMNDFYPKNT